VFLAFSLQAYAQASYKEQIYNAYVHGNMAAWARTMNAFENQKQVTVNEKLELISYYYGYTAYLVGTKKADLAYKNIAKAEKIIHEVQHEAPKNATVYAFKGSFIGFRIGLSKFKAMYLGPESNRNTSYSLALDKNNIQGNVDKANTLFHTPSLFGGDKEKSLQGYLKAVKLMELHKMTTNNWFYLNVLTLVAKNQIALEQYSAAKSTYEKILLFEPDYEWVKIKLFPELLQKIKDND